MRNVLDRSTRPTELDSRFIRHFIDIRGSANLNLNEVRLDLSRSRLTYVTIFLKHQASESGLAKVFWTFRHIQRPESHLPN